MASPISGRIVRFGDFKLDLRSGELERRGTRVILPEQPLRLLAILIRERGVLVTREDLRRELWPEGTFVDFEPSLNAALKRVRKALGDLATAPRFIETLPKRGYRFIAPVHDVTEGGMEACAAVPSDFVPDSTHGDGSVTIGHAAVTPERRTLMSGLTLGSRSWALALAIAIAALSGAAILTVRVSLTSSTGNLALERLTSDGAVRLAAVSLDGRDLAYVRRDGVRESLWFKKRDTPTATRLLEPADGTFRSLTFAGDDTLHYMFFRPDKTPVTPFRLSTRGGAPEALLEPAGRLSFNRDGSLCAYVSSFSLTLRESRIVISDSAGNAPRIIAVRRPPHSFLLTKPAWSPDGAGLVVFGRSESAPDASELLVIEVETGKVSRVLPIELVVPDGALWLPDGNRVVISGRQRSASPQRLWLFSLASGTLEPLTNDLSDYALVGLSATGQVLAVRGEVARSLWTVELHARAAPEEIANNAGDLGELEGLTCMSGDDILYTAAEDGNVDIWSVSLSRRTRRRLTSHPADDFHPSATGDGQTVVFASSRGQAPGIWTMSHDGTGQKRLTTGVDIRPSVSRDGRMLVFQRGAADNAPFTLWRLAISENQPVGIGGHHAMRPALSPDAQSIAHYWMTAEAWMLAITPTSGGPPARTLPITETHAARVVRWSPDGRALAYIDGAGGASNVWLQPLDGAPPRKLTSFAEGRITTFDWSPDGSRLVWMRVNEVRDVVALRIDVRSK